MLIDYSVVIRTLGNAGEKYRKLLDSISALDPVPQEVIVVLPEGYPLPAERLGWERFCFCRKGMVRQRLSGVDACQTQYALFCDDDVTFPPDFVEKLYRPVKEANASFSAAPLYSFLPPKGMNAALCILMASAAPTLFHRRDRYVSVLKSTGYSYNRHLDPAGKYYETQSAAWTCFFADVAAFRALELQKETWLDAHGYSALDDQTMFYKAWLMGYKTVIVSDAVYDHLDARTSTRNNKPAALYSGTFNRVVFWHRFIYRQQSNGLGRIAARLAFGYRVGWIRVWNRFSALRKRMTRADCALCRQGLSDAKKYLKSNAYRELPDLKTKM